MTADVPSAPRPGAAGAGQGAGRPEPEVVLVTGAAGRIGTYLRTRIDRPGRVLRLLDVVPVPGGAGPGEEAVLASVTDRAALAAAAEGAAAVVHLGGIANEAPWEDLLEVNIRGTHEVFEAARAAGARVVYASSNHGVGYHEDGGGELPAGLRPRPDSFYGSTKAHGEALASLYADRHGMDVVCLRIGSCFDEPGTERALGTWLSPDDAGRLVEAALDPGVRGLHTVWGVSANQRRWWSLEAGRAIGYEPQDDAEVYAGAVGAGPLGAGTPAVVPQRNVGGVAPSRSPRWS